MQEKNLSCPTYFFLGQWEKQAMMPLTELKNKGGRIGLLEKAQFVKLNL